MVFPVNLTKVGNQSVTWKRSVKEVPGLLKSGLLMKAGTRTAPRKKGFEVLNFRSVLKYFHSSSLRSVSTSARCDRTFSIKASTLLAKKNEANPLARSDVTVEKS